MDPLALVGLGLLGMFALILLHVPIGIAMAISGSVGFAALVGIKPALSLLATEPASSLASLDLIVIPLFLLMGNFATASGLSADIYRTAYSFLGHRRGGLAFATILGCAGFGAVCGSSMATTATMTRVALPEMIDRKYEQSFAAGTIAAGGTLGMMIPPSVVMVIYAFMTEQFVITMFVAAVIPSVIAVLFQLVAITLHTRMNPEAAPAGERRDFRARMIALRDGWGAIVLLGGVIGGIYGGIFTVNEAAAFGTVFAFLFMVFRGRLTKQVLMDSLRDTAANTAMIYLILFGATIFGYFVSATRMPDELVNLMQVWGLSPALVIAVLIVMYLILGSIFDTMSALLITLPFTFPLVVQMGYDPVWWGIVLVMTVEIGLITPPIGMNVFILNSMAPDISLKTIFRGITIFLWADLLRLLVVVVFPILALALPRLLEMP
ncbi:TRAP transporter large permease [Sulfitobacter sp. HI0023]|uniref:TRAP transporter large permease n=3 Tax=unclassified Sulfitobacter TaxID=196795 RepID=UPI0007C3AAB5|nr:TRAP transporter large permease [Sulfitobacter sp. HI0023]KZX98471.1 C4-dicarboxylate ABC transporter permease [Sulfitobacter sp. HI0023]